jgi:hypothetical protein
MTNEIREKLGVKLWTNSYLAHRRHTGSRQCAIDYANEALSDYKKTFEADTSTYGYTV